MAMTAERKEARKAALAKDLGEFFDGVIGEPYYEPEETVFGVLTKREVKRLVARLKSECGLEVPLACNEPEPPDPMLDEGPEPE